MRDLNSKRLAGDLCSTIFADLLLLTCQRVLAHMGGLKQRKGASVQGHSHGFGICCILKVKVMLLITQAMMYLLDNLEHLFQPQLSML